MDVDQWREDFLKKACETGVDRIVQEGPEYWKRVLDRCYACGCEYTGSLERDRNAMKLDRKLRFYRQGYPPLSEREHLKLTLDMMDQNELSKRMVSILRERQRQERQGR